MKRIIALLCLICICLVFTGCNAEERERFLAAEVLAKQNAQNYVREKYGFEPEVVEVQGSQAPSLFGTVYHPDAPVEVTMRHGDEEFMVKIIGTEVTTAGVDNYQSEEIICAIENEVQEILSAYSEYTRVKTSHLSQFYHAYYDGTNVKQLMKEDINAYLYPNDHAYTHTYTCRLIAAGMDLEHLDTEALLDKLGLASVEIVNFTDPDGYSWGTPLKETKMESLYDFLEQYSVNLTDYMTLEADGTKEYHRLKQIHCGGLVVVPFGGTYCNVEEIETDLTQWQTNLTVEGNILAAHNSFRIETDATSLRLYRENWPINLQEDTDQVLFGEKLTRNGNVSYDQLYWSDYRTRGYYYTGSIYLGDGDKTLEYCFIEVSEPGEPTVNPQTPDPTTPPESAIFATNNVKRITFYSYYGSGTGSDVPAEHLDEIITWLDSFEIDSEAPETLPPGVNTIHVEIEYLDGTVVKQGINTATVDEITYYTKSDPAPGCYEEIISKTSLD